MHDVYDLVHLVEASGAKSLKQVAAGYDTTTALSARGWPPSGFTPQELSRICMYRRRALPASASQHSSPTTRQEGRATATDYLRHVPAYMSPLDLVVINAIPLLSAGKPDHHRLRQLPDEYLAAATR